MNRRQIETAIRWRLENMPADELDRTARDMLDNVKANARLLAEHAGRSDLDLDKLTAELITEAAIRRPTDIHWLRVVIPAHAPELAVHLAPYFPCEEWLRTPGAKPTPLTDDAYLDDACFWAELAREQWQHCQKRADKPGATYEHRLEELVADAEYMAGNRCSWEANPAETHRHEELVNSLVAMLACLCSPDQGSAEAYADVGGIWRDRRYGESWPCAFDGYPYKRPTGGGDCSRFELAPTDDVNWVY